MTQHSTKSNHHPESIQSLEWRYQSQPGTSKKAVFHSVDWHTHKGDVGRLRRLELCQGDRVMACLSVRELHIPGLFKRWVIQGEPYQLVAPLDHEMTLRHLHRFALNERVDVLSCVFNMARWSEDAVKSVCPIEAVESFGTYVMDLSSGMDTIETGMRSNFRRSLKKARAAIPRVTEAVEVDDFMDLLATSYGHTGRSLPFGRRYFDALLNRPKVPTICVGIYGENDQLDATGLVVYDTQRGYYLHGAARRNGLHGAAILLQCELMKRLITRDVPEYDLGGARLETTDKRLAGIASFKRRFGGTYEPVGRFEWGISTRGRAYLGPLKSAIGRIKAPFG